MRTCVVYAFLVAILRRWLQLAFKYPLSSVQSLSSLTSLLSVVLILYSVTLYISVVSHANHFTFR